MAENLNIQHLRKEYSGRVLDIQHVDSDPIQQFQHWFTEASRSEVAEPNAMILSTLGNHEQIHARVVLLKEIENDRFIFYTNQLSTKGKDMKVHPRVHCLFFWVELSRQIHIEGSVIPVPDAQAEAYFHTRPRESQIGAWASEQSTIIPSRQTLEDRFKEFSNKYENRSIPKPPHWGGYAVTPTRIEFWQGRPNRLHDRIQYCLNKNAWEISRLAP